MSINLARFWIIQKTICFLDYRNVFKRLLSLSWMADAVLPWLGFSPSTLIEVIEGKKNYAENAQTVAEGAEFLYSAARGCKRMYNKPVTERPNSISAFEETEDFRNYHLILKSFPHAFIQTPGELINQLENCADCLRVLHSLPAGNEDIVASVHKGQAGAMFYSLKRYIEKLSKVVDKE